MTYNVFWEAFDTSRQTQCKSRSGINKCVRVMAYFIAYYLPDILCLQEIREDVQWIALRAALRHYIPTFDTMYTWRSTAQGNAGMMTVYNSKKFELVSERAGDFLGPATHAKSGRPYLALLLKWNVDRQRSAYSGSPHLLVVNVHLPHRKELVPLTADACFAQLEALVASFSFSYLVVAGDFNRDPDTYSLSRLGLVKHPEDTFATSMDHDTGTVIHKYDHIYSSLPQNRDKASYHRVPLGGNQEEEAAFENFMFRNGRPVMSDHFPVLATYKLPFGDFYSTPPYEQPPVPPLTRPDLANEMLFLVHAVCPELPLSPPPETWTELRVGKDDADGLYTTLITKSNYDLTWVFGYRPGRTAYVFVLPLDVLKYPNYHISLSDQYGHMNASTTYMPWQLPQAVKHIKNQCEFIHNHRGFNTELQNKLRTVANDAKTYTPFNEVVFSNPIQLRPNCFKLFKYTKRKDILTIKDVVPRFKYEQPLCEPFNATPDPNQPNPCFPPSQYMLYNGERSRFYNELNETVAGQTATKLYQRTLGKVCQPADRVLTVQDRWIPDPSVPKLQDPYQSHLHAFFSDNFPDYLTQHQKPRMSEFADWEDFQKSAMYQEIQNGALYRPVVQRFLEGEDVIPTVPQNWQDRVRLQLRPLDKKHGIDTGDTDEEEEESEADGGVEERKGGEPKTKRPKVSVPPSPPLLPESSSSAYAIAPPPDTSSPAYAAWRAMTMPATPPSPPLSPAWAPAVPPSAPLSYAAMATPPPAPLSPAPAWAPAVAPSAPLSYAAMATPPPAPLSPAWAPVMPPVIDLRTPPASPGVVDLTTPPPMPPASPAPRRSPSSGSAPLFQGPLYWA